MMCKFDANLVESMPKALTGFCISGKLASGNDASVWHQENPINLAMVHGRERCR